MKSNLLATKLRRPSPPAKRIARPYLGHILNDGLAAGHQLSLICAPAGFGKSTCITDWIARIDLPAAWLSLDKQDDDPGRFFPYLVAALQSVDTTLGQDIASVLQSGQLPPNEVITNSLINDISRMDGKFLLILDDFQVIQDHTILQALERLVTSQLPPLHLVIITREDPVLPLARLRANNLLTEIRAGDLRFSSDEIDRFFSEIMGLLLSGEDIRALENRTEGWIAGLQLAGLSMRGRDDPSSFIANLSGSHRYILGYLTEEVLSRQTEEIQDFLLQTSILDKLSGDLCGAVTGRSDSNLLLERLCTANLFLIPLDDELRWYRYHHLFADLLRSQRSRLPKELVTQLHTRASQWYEDNGMVVEAVEHALAAGDYRHCVQLLELYALRLITQGYVKAVESWMQAIPQEWHAQSPRANLAFAWMYLLRGNYARVGPYLIQADRAISHAETMSEDNGELRASELRAEWLALQSNLLHVLGKAAESIEAANLALESITPDSFSLRGYAYLGLGGAYRQAGDYPRSVEAYQQAIQNSWAAGNVIPEMLAVSTLVLMAIQHGQLRFAAEVGAQAIERLDRAGGTPPPISGAVYGALGIIYYEWDQIEKAREHLLKGIRLSTFAGHNASIIYIEVAMARLYQAAGDLEAAAKAIQQAADLLLTGAPTWLKPEVAAQQVRVYLAQHNPVSAEAVLQQSGVPGQAPDRHIRDGSSPAELLTIAYLRLILYQAQNHLTSGDLQAGIDLAGRLITAATQGQRVGVLLQALLLRAQMQAVLGNSPASLEDLSQALELAEPEGFTRTFVDEGHSMEALLRECLEAEVKTEEGTTQFAKREFARKLCAAFVGPADASITLRQKTESVELPRASRVPSNLAAPVEALTEREVEVLRLMAEGLKYEEIATQLVITLNTVRFHVKAIYSKLNVNNRTKAIEVARQLGLLQAQ